MGSALIQSPDARLLMLGAGVFLINEFDTNGALTYWRHMGNVTSGELTQAVTKLTKRESMTRARNVYLDLQKDQTFTLALSLDEWSVNNVGLYLRGTSAATAAQAATPVTGEVVTTTAVLGASYFLAKYGAVSAVTLNNTTTTTPLVLGTDYTIDLETGRITILSTATNVAAGDDISADYTPTAYASGLTQIKAGQRSTPRGQIRFIGDPQNGPRMVVDFWKTSISANANAQLISPPDATDTSQLALVATVEADLTNHADSPLYTVTYI
jgi:hypothetical protein